MSLQTSLWDRCLGYLRDEIPPQQYNTWIRPLHAIELKKDGLLLLAPNKFILDWINERFLNRITELLDELSDTPPKISLQIDSKSMTEIQVKSRSASELLFKRIISPSETITARTQANINSNFTFDNFVEGKSNQLACAAATQVAENPRQAYNPLFTYGGVGLGKTHLMHAVGNTILRKDPTKKVLYIHSERFVADMIKALQFNAMNEFKRFYRSLNALLIDDIQFFAGKDRSQEEFFHTFNALLDSQQQIILTCDRYPKEINGLEERLQSRFGWGLTVSIEPPELETRVAILISKAKQLRVHLPHEVAFFIAKNIQSNVRELEGALKRVIASAHFTNQLITVDLTRNVLKDLLTLHARLITIENIQKTIAEYYKIKVTDLLARKRNRSIASPRQMAMALAKELTNHSLPEIGDAFGGRDHTTVLHACRKIKKLLITSLDILEDYQNLMRILSG